MFEINLGSGKKFTATSVEERYNAATQYQAAAFNLNIECNPADQDIDGYKTMLTEEGATESIEVKFGEASVATYTGYTNLQNLSVRLLPTGDKSASIFLTKEIAPAE